jgi:hypothetical protein
MSNFVIACLPGSDEAWLATVLNAVTPLRVWFEGLASGKLFLPNEGTVGSDALIPLYGSRINHLEPIHFFLYRDEEECKAVVKEFGEYTPEGWDVATKWAEEYIDTFKPIMISHRDMIGAIHRICEEVGVTEEVDVDMLAQMIDMKVEAL